ncbi:MAG: hypothetical protein KatS3mg108_1566 [Isosphaeraceae bacterium]|jgi:hypothetical protein|nr:MAG: hypothetical protein KatS3mg108_1566 [Isosphaeraceae bacterium]
MKPLHWFRTAACWLLVLASSASAQEGVSSGEPMDPWIGYTVLLAVAGAGVFLVCKSARRS